MHLQIIKLKLIGFVIFIQLMKNINNNNWLNNWQKNQQKIK